MFFVKTISSITVIIDNTPYNIPHTHPSFAALTKAVDAKDTDAARDIVTARQALHNLEAIFGDIEVCGGQVRHKGRQIHSYLVDLILAVPEDPTPMIAFLDNVMKNPSSRAVQDLYRWCEYAKLPITPDGHIVAYKIVRDDYLDHYTQTFNNSVGQIVEVGRNEVDDDPSVTCSHGLHFCSAEYLPHYGPSNGRVMLVKVNPADVVAFPTDYRFSKARCCRYEVIQEIDKDTAAAFFPVNTYVWGPEHEDEDPLEGEEIEDLAEQALHDRIATLLADLKIRVINMPEPEQMVSTLEMLLFGVIQPWIVLDDRIKRLEDLVAQAKASQQ